MLNQMEDQQESFLDKDLERDQHAAKKFLKKKIRMKWVLGFGILSLLLIVSIIIGFSTRSCSSGPSTFLIDGPQEHQNWGKEARTTVLQSEPLTIMGGKHLEWATPLPADPFGIQSISAAGLLLKEISFRLVDADTQRTVPLEHVYNHHTIISTDRNGFQVVAGFGAEGPGTIPTQFPAYPGYYLGADENLMFSGEWIDMFGKVATINQTIRAEFKISWIPVMAVDASQYAANRLFFGYFGASGGENAEFPIAPGPLGKATCVVRQTPWTYPSVAVHHLIGHIHIGAINLTLVEATSKKMLAVSTPKYDQFGFVISLDSQYEPGFTISKNTEYIVTACYENRVQGYAAAMGLFAVYYENLEDPSSPAWSQ